MTRLQESRVALNYNNFSILPCDGSRSINNVGVEHATMSVENLGKPVLSEPKTIACSAALPALLQTLTSHVPTRDLVRVHNYYQQYPHPCFRTPNRAASMI